MRTDEGVRGISGNRLTYLRLVKARTLEQKARKLHRLRKAKL
jgi:hypothetical protein